MAYPGEDINDQILNQSRNAVKWKIKNRKDIYKDDWDYIIREELQRQFVNDTYEDLRLLTTKELNLLRRVINEISTIYKQPAARTVEIGEGESAAADPVYEEIIDQSDYNVFMSQVNRYTNLCNCALQRIVWRDDKIDFDLLTFDNAEILTDDDDWKKIKAVKIYLGLELPYYDEMIDSKPMGVAKFRYNPIPFGSTMNRYDDYKYAYLYVLEEDSAWLYKFQKLHGTGKEKLLSREPLPYQVDGKPVLPFVLYTKNYPVDRLLDFTSGDDLIDLTVNVAVNYVHFNNLWKYQSWKQIYALVENTDSIPADIGLNPQRVMAIPAGREGKTSIGVLDIQASIKEQFDTMLDRIRVGLAQYGMDAEGFTRSGAAESGFKLKVKKEGLNEIRESQLPIYRCGEYKAFEIIRAVNNYHNMNKISDMAKFSIDFGDPTFVTSEEEQNRNWQTKITNNVSSVLDWIKANNPDIETDEEAMEVYQKNKMINNATRIPAMPIIQPQTIKQPGEKT